MNEYLEMKNKNSKEFNEFPMFFAFSHKQFDEGMAKLGLKKDDTDKVYRGPAGMIYRKTDAKALKEMMDRHAKDHEDAVKADLTGEGFIFQMFLYELHNHEYGYTCDPEDTLMACGVTYEDVQKEGPLKTGFNNACTTCMAESC